MEIHKFNSGIYEIHIYYWNISNFKMVHFVFGDPRTGQTEQDTQSGMKTIAIEISSTQSHISYSVSPKMSCPPLYNATA